MPEQLIWGTEVFLNGLMAGVLYALVALGFVLIYKASGIFNYAQGLFLINICRCRRIERGEDRGARD